MKHIYLVLIAIFSSMLIYAQEYINIGSTKFEVKKVMGEPTSINHFEITNTEIWGYGEYGLATITFKNNVVFEFYNHGSILKIGEKIKSNSKDNPLLTGDKKVLEDLQKQSAEPEVKNKKQGLEEFYPKELLETIKNSKTKNLPPIGHNSLTGITSFEPRAQAPTGRYKKLYEEGKIDLFGDRSDWEEVAYQNQSFFEIAKNTFLGTLLNFTAGFLDSGSSSDIKGIFDTAMGNTEENYGNIVHDFAQSIMKYSENNFPIFTSKDNSMFSASFWAKQLQSLGFTMGIIGEILFMAILAFLFTKFLYKYSRKNLFMDTRK